MTETAIEGSPLVDLLPSDFSKHILDKISALEPFLKGLQCLSSYETKLSYIDTLSIVKDFLEKRPALQGCLEQLSIVEQYLCKAMIIIEQGERLFSFHDEDTALHREDIVALLEDLKPVEEFYDAMGGVVGYHMTSLKIMHEATKTEKTDHEYFPPFGEDVTQDSLDLRKKIVEGIAFQGEMAEICPVGGAADRLNLQDEKTQENLPAARLEFLGHTLLEWIIRDLQAREYLHFNIFHRQVTTPIALMTSQEKNNDHLVQEIVSEKCFFSRPQESFKFFCQPLVPTFTQEGHWCLSRPMKLLLKPGGHGAIWKLAFDAQIFQWLAQLQRKKAIVRQINNPIAGVDFGLLALTGIGCVEKKSLGFASCVRRVKTAEGMNILKQTKVAQGFSIVLSNIEYCDFKKCGIQDVPKDETKPYSVFPSNTNVLFVDLAAIQEALEKVTYPGMLVNFRKMPYYDPDKGYVQGQVARLELLMQNIADGFEEIFKSSLEEEPRPVLKSFITFNKRHKTISPTKKQFVPGSGLVETAFGCFYDYLTNAQELLEQHCHFRLPELPFEEDFLDKGPSFIFVYHPALGPLYEVIGQKLRGGCLGEYAELQLEIAEANIEQLEVYGSLRVRAQQVMGHEEGRLLRYSSKVGRCYMKNVIVKNQGIDVTQENVYWKNKVYRQETCDVYLEGNSEFIAENVVFEGNYTIVVKDGERVIARQQGNQVVFERETIANNSSKPGWRYRVAPDYHISLEWNV